ncbi:fluoride efflux transporter CrcB [Granulosicoccus sp. 3-233]|uniref:fluoride efflux transporter CrcB n=1 Tax=Granulosicoccus sp. 3-233 TaxID=3417969 RepID=UPI003D3463E3
MNYLYVGLGGAMGACLRYSISLLMARELLRFPLATLTANILGALLAGIIATWFWSRGLFGTPLQLLLVVGFLGGFTTFSTFSVETLRLLEEGARVMALLNMALNLFGSLLAVFLGSALVRWFLQT